MNSARKTALVAGVFYLISFVSIPTLLLYTAVHEPNFIVGPGPDTPVLIGGVLEMIVALAGLGSAVVLYPILKRQNQSMALGLVGTRTIEGAVIVVGVACLLTVVTLRQAGVVWSRWGIPGSQGSGPSWQVGGSGRRQSRTAARSAAAWSSRPAAAVCRWRSGCSPVSAARVSRCARRSAGRAGHGHALVGLYDRLFLEPEQLPAFNACCTPGGVEQPSSRVAPFPQHRGGRGGGVIAGEDLLEHLGRPTRCHGIRSNDGVRVAVADDL